MNRALKDSLTPAIKQIEFHGARPLHCEGFKFDVAFSRLVSIAVPDAAELQQQIFNQEEVDCTRSLRAPTL